MNQAAEIIKIDHIFGHIEIKPTCRIEGNKLISGGFITSYDRNGNEIASVANTDLCSAFIPSGELGKVNRWLLEKGFK